MIVLRKQCVIKMQLAVKRIMSLKSCNMRKCVHPIDWMDGVKW